MVPNHGNSPFVDRRRLLQWDGCILFSRSERKGAYLLDIAEGFELLAGFVAELGGVAG